MESYGARVRRIRGNESRESFSERIGITVEALIAYETGQRLPRDEVKARITAAMQAGPDSFFAEEEHYKCI